MLPTVARLEIHRKLIKISKVVSTSKHDQCPDLPGPSWYIIVSVTTADLQTYNNNIQIRSQPASSRGSEEARTELGLETCQVGSEMRRETEAEEKSMRMKMEVCTSHDTISTLIGAYVWSAALNVTNFSSLHMVTPWESSLPMDEAQVTSSK